MALRSIAVACILLAAGAVSASAEEPTAPPPEAEMQWVDFQVPERGFAVSFPSPPQKSIEAVAGQNPLIRHSFKSYEGEDTVYTVVVLEYPAGKAPNPPGEAMYVKMISAYAKESSSKVRKRGAKTIAGQDGFEAITDESKAKLNHRVSIVPSGDRIYMLISAGPRGHIPSEAADRFRDSFRLTGASSHSAVEPPAPSP